MRVKASATIGRHAHTHREREGGRSRRMMDAHGLTLPLLLLSPFLAWGAVVLAQLGMYWRGHSTEIHRKDRFRDDALRSQQRLMRMEREEEEKRDWERRLFLTLKRQTGTAGPSEPCPLLSTGCFNECLRHPCQSYCHESVDFSGLATPPVTQRIWSQEEIEYAYGASQRIWQREGGEWKAYRDLVRRGMWS